MVRPFPVLNVLSVLIVVFALAMLLPLCVSLGYGDAARNAHEKAVLITFVSGAILWVVTRSRRCELQWLGGMGIIVLAVAILPLLGIGGSQIMRTETPGPMKDTQLTPRITETAKGLWLVYAVMTLACVLVFKAAGMGWFDAVVH